MKDEMHLFKRNRDVIVIPTHISWSEVFRTLGNRYSTWFSLLNRIKKSLHLEKSIDYAANQPTDIPSVIHKCSPYIIPH